MANQAHKKNVANAKSKRQFLFTALAVIYALYILIRVVWYWSSFTSWTFSGLSLLTGVNYFCVKTILRASEIGATYTFYEDWLYINWFVQVGTIFSSRFWYVYPVAVILVVGYARRNWVKQIVAACFAKREVEKPRELSAEEQKRLDKKQRKAERPRFVASRR